MNWPSRVKLLVAVAAVVAALALAFRVHAFFLFPHAVLVGFDDRYIAPFGMRLLEGGGLPYVDAVSQRGPVLYWAVALFQRIFGVFDWASLRWLGVSCAFVTMAASFAVGLAARRPLAGALGAIVFAYATTYAIDIGGGLGVVGEMVATPLGMVALALAAFALDRPDSERPRWLVPNLTRPTKEAPRWVGTPKNRAFSGREGACPPEKDKSRRLVPLQHQPPRGGLLFLCGIFAGLSGLAKQTSLSTILPLSLFAAAVAWTRIPRPFFAKKGGIRPVAALLLGWALPIFAVLGLYAKAGELGTFWYWFYTYNAHSHMEPYVGSSKLRLIMGWVDGEPFVVLALVVVLVMALVSPLLQARSLSARDLASGYATAGLEVTVGALATLAMLAALAQFRFWPHHFVPAIAWLGLLVGLRMESMLGAARWPSVIGGGAVALAMVGLLAQATEARLSKLKSSRKSGGYTHERANPVCEAIDAYSQPSDPIFLWGFDGDFYVDCQRRPASRFVFTASVAGIVPPRWGEPKPVRVARGAPDLLEAELRESQPPLILDFYKSLGKNTSMRNTPQLARLLDEAYCKLPDVSARGRTAAVWVRRDLGRCPEKSPR